MNKELLIKKRSKYPFRLFIIYGYNEGDPQYFYPSITMESVLLKVGEHLLPHMVQEDLQELLKEIEETLDDRFEFEVDEINFLIHKLDAKEIYKPKEKNRKRNTHV
jgi:hypothetical protein